MTVIQERKDCDTYENCKRGEKDYNNFYKRNISTEKAKGKEIL